LSSEKDQLNSQLFSDNKHDIEDKTDFYNNASSNVSTSNHTSSVASSYCYGLSPNTTSNVPKQVGVIKPMTREDLIQNEKPGTQNSDATSPTIELKQNYNGTRSQNNHATNTDVLNKMNSTMSQVAAIRAAAAKPTAGVNDNEFPAKFQKVEPISEELTNRPNYTLGSKYSNTDKNVSESSKYKQPLLKTEITTASNKESVHATNLSVNKAEKTMTNHVLMSNNSNLSSSIAKQHYNNVSDSTHHTNSNSVTINKNSATNNDKNNVPSVIKERELSNNGTTTYNDMIVSAKPAKVVSMKKGDSLSSSASNSSSSDEESASERNGSYDLVIAEENRINGIMSTTDKVEFPAKKYEIINKSEVNKGFISNESNKNDSTSNNTNTGNGDVSYRENWKARNKAEQQNTMVFNFVNTKRDVTHIENDGLDLSKRNTSKKKTQVQLSKVRKYTFKNFLVACLMQKITYPKYINIFEFQFNRFETKIQYATFKDVL
jgi:hypothetical protein